MIEYLKRAARRNFMRARIRYLLTATSLLIKAGTTLEKARAVQREIGGDVVRWYALGKASRDALNLAGDVSNFTQDAITQLEEAKRR